MSNIFKSRKFYAAVVALLFAFFGARAGIDEKTVSEAVYILISYIVGTALEGIRKA